MGHGKPRAWGPSGENRRPKLQRERVLQGACVQLFAVGRGHRIGILFAIPNGEDRHPVVAAILSGINIEDRRRLPIEDRLMPAGQGVLQGANDLILLAPRARIVLFECKVLADPVLGLKAGKQSQEQEIFQARCQELGHDYRVITNTTDFWDACVEYDVPLLTQRPFNHVPRPLPGVVGAVKPRRRKSAAPPAQEPPGNHRWSLP